tara:strand:- start:1470 stop:1595 length:126 start_codon:yes stop_codon:yes gene_type:complete
MSILLEKENRGKANCLIGCQLSASMIRKRKEEEEIIIDEEE